MSAISDTTTQLVGAIVIAHHSVRYDIKYFPELFKRMSELANIRTIMLDKGCNAEYVHELILSAGAIEFMRNQKFIQIFCTYFADFIIIVS